MEAHLKEELKGAQATLQSLSYAINKASNELDKLSTKDTPTTDDFQETVGWVSAVASDAGHLETRLYRLSTGRG